MDFLEVIRQVGARLDEAGIRYALIGGFGMAMRGVQRATVDLDFIVLLDNLETVHRTLSTLGYEREFHSDNVSHYQAKNTKLGRIDILHAFRAPTLSMLERAQRLEVAYGLFLPVARTEDIIGLKIQAAFNDPQREAADWQDIRMLIEAAASQRTALDWELIGDYLAIFEQPERLGQLEQWYGETD